ncbi:MAG: DUF4097 family beta strand repeat protein [Anaerolineae bacterium]|nr:DUF4097 family beta strand repeat protein [Anaerolineae bacterium]
MDDQEITGTPDTGKKKREDVLSGAQRKSRAPLYVLIGCLLFPCLCCAAPLCLVIGGGVTLATVFEHSKASASYTETVDVVPGETIILDVDNRVGDIEIRTGAADDQVIVEYTKTAYAFNKGSARDELDKINVDITSSGQTITIQVEQDSNEDTFLFRANEVNMTITIPSDAEITVENNVGQITLEGVHARALDLQTNTGSITFEGSLRQTGDYNIRTNVGDVTLRLPDGTYIEVDAETDVGEVSVSGFEISNRDEGGSVPGEAWRGTLGDGAESAPTLRVRTNVGDITIERD